MKQACEFKEDGDMHQLQVAMQLDEDMSTVEKLYASRIATITLVQSEYQ